MKRNEEEKFDKICDFFDRAKIKYRREVVPDQCKNWELPYRVDLIIYIPDYGYIGIEGKHIRSLGQGGVIGKAIKQIKYKYYDKSYFGKKIRQWCLYLPRFHDIDNDRNRVFTRHLLNALGLGFIEYFNTPYSEYVVINSGTIYGIQIYVDGTITMKDKIKTKEWDII